jgi:hypothetical protein
MRCRYGKALRARRATSSYGAAAPPQGGQPAAPPLDGAGSGSELRDRLVAALEQRDRLTAELERIWGWHEHTILSQAPTSPELRCPRKRGNSTVASTSTAFRVIVRIASDPGGLERLRAAHAVARSLAR